MLLHEIILNHLIDNGYLIKETPCFNVPNGRLGPKYSVTWPLHHTIALTFLDDRFIQIDLDYFSPTPPIDDFNLVFSDMGIMPKLDMCAPNSIDQLDASLDELCKCKRLWATSGGKCGSHS